MHTIIITIGTKGNNFSSWLYILQFIICKYTIIPNINISFLLSYLSPINGFNTAVL